MENARTFAFQIVLPFPRLRVWQCLQVCLEISAAKVDLIVLIGLRVLIALAKPCPYLSRLHFLILFLPLITLEPANKKRPQSLLFVRIRTSSLLKCLLRAFELVLPNEVGA